MASLLALASLVPVSLLAAAVGRRTLARAYLVAGSALAAVLVAMTANVVGGVGFEVAVLAIAASLRLVATVAASRRRARNLRRRQRRRLASVRAESGSIAA